MFTQTARMIHPNMESRPQARHGCPVCLCQEYLHNSVKFLVAAASGNSDRQY